MLAALSPIEEEVVFLRAVLDAINAMVNFSVMSLHGSDPDCSILFATPVHQKYFNIALVDFLSRTDEKGPVAQASYLGALRGICAHPNFAKNGTDAGLHKSVGEFVSWLESEITVDVWFPTINFNAPLSLRRIDYIKMTGDLSKHNFLRAVGVAEKLQQLLARQGTRISLDDALMALGSFYEWFHDHVLNYHGSTIAEYLNNIRWGIHDYLQSEFEHSLARKNRSSPKYEFTYPPGVTSNFGKENYWDLINLVRSKPYMRKFQVTMWQKTRY